MAVSVRMDPHLERDLEAAAKRQGITKSQFIVDAVQRALGRKNPVELMLKLQAEEEKAWLKAGRRLPSTPPTLPDRAAKVAMVNKLKEKHGVGRTG
jgi:hypothetical protein